MHELSIALGILDVAEEEAARQGSARVAAIHLQLGALSGVVKEALLRAYELARSGTALEDAELVVEEVPVTVHCPRCMVEQPVLSVQQLCCSVCETPTPQIVRGRELQIVALEIET